MAFTQVIKTLGSVMASMKTAVDTWLSTNITNPSNPPLDRSLSLANACAPADMVGDLKNEIANKVDEPSSEGTDGQVLATDGDGGRYWKTVSGGGGGGTSDYTDLTNKPKINNVTLSGNKSLTDLGIMSNENVTITDQNKSSYFTDCNDAPANSVFRIAASAEMANSPYGMGISTASAVYDGTVRSMTGYVDGDLYTFAVDDSKQQFYVTNRADGRQIIHFRTKYASNYSWSKWNYISSVSNLASSNIAIRKKMIAKWLDGQGNPTAETRAFRTLSI